MHAEAGDQLTLDRPVRDGDVVEVRGRAGSPRDPGPGSRRPEIVVGVDCSPSCRAAVEFAVREAELRDAELVAVMAVRPTRHGTSSYSAAGTSHFAEEQLREFLESVGTGALHVHLVITVRPAAETLVGRSRHADLLVVGAHTGRTTPALAVDSESLAGARCPVVVVRSFDEPGTDSDPYNVARFI